VLEAALVVVRFGHFTAALVLFGWLLFPLAVNHGTPPPRRAIVCFATLALLSGVGWFVLTAGSIAGDLSKALEPATLNAVVFQTDFGPAWLGRLALIAAIIPWAAMAPRHPRSAPLTAASGVVVASLAATGHAQIGDGPVWALHAGADALHLLAAGAWLGGIVGLAAMLQGRSDANETEAAHGFAGLGYAAVAVLVASGLVNTLTLLSGPTALVRTDYGRLLSVKLALFGVMLALAAANRFRLAQRVGWETGPTLAAGLRRNVVVELALGVAVITAVSLLGTLSTTAPA